MLSARKRADVRRHFRILRASVGLSQTDAALKSKLAFYRYRLIENGYELASDDERDALSKTFKTTPDQIYPLEMAAVAS